MKKLTIITILAMFAMAATLTVVTPAYAALGVGGMGSGGAYSESLTPTPLSTLAGPTTITGLVRNGQTISTIARSGGIVTVTFSTAYPNLKVGQPIYIYYATGFDGIFTIRSVSSDYKTFTYLQSAPDATGTCTDTVYPPAAGGQYTSIGSWNADRQGDNTARNTVEVAECYNDWGSGGETNEVLPINIAGWTTGANNYIRIYAPASEKFSVHYDSGFAIAATAISSKDMVDINSSASPDSTNNVRIEGIGFKLTNTSSYTGSVINIGAGSDIRINNNLITGAISGTGSFIGIYGNGSTVTSKIYNNIIYGFKNGSTGGNAGISTAPGGGTYYLYNNSLSNNYVGIYRFMGSSVTAKNNIAAGNDTDYLGTFEGSSTNNIAATGTAPGSNAYTFTMAEIAFMSTAAATMDLHIQSGSAVADPGLGANLSADSNCPFSTDIDGYARPASPGAWCPGAVENTIKEFICTIRATGGDYAKLSDWLAILQGVDFTSSAKTTRVFSITGVTGTVYDGAPVTLYRGGNSVPGNITGTVVHVNNLKTQVLIRSMSSTTAYCQYGDQWRIGGSSSNMVTITDGGNGAIPVAECYNDWPSGLNDTVAISCNPSGIINDSQHKIVIRAPSGQRHNGIPHTGFYLNPVLSVGQFCLDIGGSANAAQNIRIEGIEVDYQGSSANCGGIGHSGTATLNNIEIVNCLIHANSNATGSAGIGLTGDTASSSSNSPIKIYNNFVYAEPGAGISVAGNMSSYAFVYNNTVYNCGAGFYTDQYAKFLAKNDAALGNITQDFSGTSSPAFAYAASSYNCSSDGSVIGSNGLSNSTAANNFMSLTTPDMHLQITAPVIGKGTNLTSDPDSGISFSTDIDGDTRSATDNWCIGADEYIVCTWTGNAPAGSRTDWYNAGNWQPAVVPTAGASVYIPSTTNKPTLAGTAATIKSLTIQNGGVLTLNADLTLTGDLTVNATGAIVRGTSTLTFAGSTQTINGTVGTLSVPGIYHLVISSSTQLDLNSCAVYAYDVTVKSGATLRLDNASDMLTTTTTLTNNGTITQSGGTLTATGALTNNAAITHSGGTIVCSSYYTDAGAGTYAGSGGTNGATFKPTTYILLTKSSGTTFNNLEIPSSGAYISNSTTATPIVVSNNFIIDSSASFTTNNKPMTVGGNWTNNGTFTQGTGTVTFNGASNQTIKSGSGTFNALTIAKTDSGITLSDQLSVSGNFTRTGSGACSITGAAVNFMGSSSTATVSAGLTCEAITISKTAGQTLTVVSGSQLTATSALTLTQGIVSGGTLATNGTVTFGSSFPGSSSTAALTINSSASSPFDLSAIAANLPTGPLTLNAVSSTIAMTGTGTFPGPVTVAGGTASFAGGYTYTFTAGSLFTVGASGTVNFSGNSSNMVTLRSSSTNSYWNIANSGIVNADYCDIEDSRVTTAPPNINATNSKNSGNNSGWNFPANLTNWDLDMNLGTLTLYCDSAMSQIPFDPTKITIQDQATAASSYTLTNGTTVSGISPDLKTVTIQLSADDIDAIKANANIAKSITNSYITLAATVLKDTVGNNMNVILNGSGKQAQAYTADVTAPTLSGGWTIDMNTHLMELTFNEPVSIGTFNKSKITIQDNSGHSYQLTGTYASGTYGSLSAGQYAVGSTNKLKLQIKFATTDFNALLDDPNIAKGTSSSYLVVASGSGIQDMATNAFLLTPNQASSWADNNAAATKFKVTDTSTGNSSVSMTAGIPPTGQIITIKTYDDSGYRTKLYSGPQALVFSGANNAPNPTDNLYLHPQAKDVNDSDSAYAAFSSDTTINFTNGVGSAKMRLYCAETANISVSSSLTTMTALAATVGPAAKRRLLFSQEPPSAGTVSLALVPQPKVKVVDDFGNRTADSIGEVWIYASTTNDSYNPPPDVGKFYDDSHSTYAVASIVSGEAVFSGVRYNLGQTVYMEATSHGVSPALIVAFTQTPTVFSLAATTTVDVSPSSPTAFSLIPTNDTLGEKFTVLQFRIQDYGVDGVATKIDKLRIAVGGTGGHASNDIAWVELVGAKISGSGTYQDRQIASTTATPSIVSISDTTGITFGTTANNNNAGDLDEVPDSATVEYTVNIYMKNSQLQATDHQTYTFNTSGSLVDIDNAVTSSGITISANPPQLDTGTINVAYDHLEIVSFADGASTSGTLTAGTAYPLTIRTTDANKNIDTDISNQNLSLMFSGLNPIGSYKPKVGAGVFTEIPASISFTNGVSAQGSSKPQLTAYKAETGTVTCTDDGNGVYSSYGFTATVNALAASTFAKSAGDNQIGKTSKKLPNPCVVISTDTYGNMVPNVPVTFAASGPSGSNPIVDTDSTTTNPSGVAQTYLTLGSIEGESEYHVIASSSGFTNISFNATGRTPASIVKAAGDGQTAAVTQQLTNSFVASLVNGNSQPVPNETINFDIITTPPSASGSVTTPGSGNTNSSGQTSTRLTLGDKSGDYVVRATYSGVTPSLTADFTGHATSSAPYQVAFTAYPPNVVVDQPSGAFTITVEDSSGNAANVSTDTLFNLATTPPLTGAFYSNSGCTSVITQTTVSSGLSSATFYYKGTQAGTIPITATWSSGDSRLDLAHRSSTVSLSVLPEAINYFKVEGAATNMATGDSRSITVTAYDRLNNILTNYTGDLGVTFSGANPSPSTQAPTSQNLSGADVAFGSASIPMIHFANGIATTIIKLYKAEDVAIKATSGSTTTSDTYDLNITVKHGIADHTKLHASLPTQQTAGVSFPFGTTVDVVDKYDNICDGAVVPGDAYTNSNVPVQLMIVGGDANGPDGTLDVFPATLSFTQGRSTTQPNATLYRAQQNIYIIVDVPSLPKLAGNVRSSLFNVVAGSINKLSFSQLPTTTGTITTHPLASQPWIAVADQYGNPCLNASAQIILAASTTTGTFTGATNGTLTSDAANNTVTLTNGVAKFTGLTYSYPETIYLRASVVGYSLDAIYSLGIPFTPTTDLSVTQVTSGISDTVSSVANGTSQKTSVFAFKIADSGSDGLNGELTKVVVNRAALDTKDWTQYINAAWLSYNGVDVPGTISANKITFDGAGLTLFAVPDNTTENTFTLKITTKNTLPAGADGEIFRFTLNAAADITVGSHGSYFTSVSAMDKTCILAVAATTFWITGGTTMAAGDSNTITIRAVDANRNIDKDYTGSKVLTFSGATTIGTNPVYAPTCSGLGGGTSPFGEQTTISFTNGSATSGMTLYKSEIAVITATDINTYLGNTIGTTSANSLTVSVTAGAPTKLTWNTQPVDHIVKLAPWKEFSVGLTDSYGNITLTDNVEITIAPVGLAQVAQGATYKVMTRSGLARFSDFYVTCSPPAIIQLVATATGFTDSDQSNSVNVEGTYLVTINAKDSVSSALLTDVTFTITDSQGNAVPVTLQNNPLTVSLPYGTYSLQLGKEKYVDATASLALGYAIDGADGHYDNVITYNVYVTSIEEAQADYNVQSSFVYDETNQDLTIRLWLDRRGKLVLNTEANRLATAYVYIFDDSLNGGTVLPPIIFTPPNLTEGTYSQTMANVLSASNIVGDALVPGKTYFARCVIGYGGTDALNPWSSYEVGTTFTVSISQQLAQQVLGGIPQGQTLLSAVGLQVAAVGAKVDTAISKVDIVSSKVETVSSKVDTVSTNLTAASSNVTAILSDVTTTLPAQISATVTAQAEKGIPSEILTRNSVIRTGDTIAIRYRTATGLTPTLTIYDADGKIVTPGPVVSGTTYTTYSNIPMKEIAAGAGIYELTVTAEDSWAAGDNALDYTVICQETTKGSKDSMILTVAPIFVIGATVEQTMENLGYAVTKVYSRAGTIQTLLGTKTDTVKANTVMGQVNGLNSTINGLNLTSVATNSKEARMNALRAADDISTIKGQFTDMQTKIDSLKDLSSQLDALKSSLAKISQATGAPGIVGAGMTTPVSVGAGSGGIAPEEAGAGIAGGRGLSEGEKIAIKIAKGEMGPGAASKAPGKEALQPQGVTSVMAGDFARQHDIKEVSNKVEELTALTKIVTKLIENTSNKPVVEGWFEKE